MHIDLTVVIGLDAKTLGQWKLSLPTIAVNRRELLSIPWTVFYDWSQICADSVLQVAEANGLDRSPHLRFVPWPPDDCEQDWPSQRGKMLAGFVHVPAHHVGTEWWMKIDTDVVAMRIDKPWQNTDWFQHDVVLIASPWGYSKCKGDNRTALEWAESLEEFGDACWTCTPRLGLTECVRGRDKIIKPRIWSPVSYYRTSWTKEVSALCSRHYGPYGLPVPSQDTTHWVAAERSGSRIVKVNQKKFGWSFCPSTRLLATACRLALQEHAI